MPRKSAVSRHAPIAKPVDEKLTVNIGCIDLGQIDLLVQKGFHATRSDFIRTAIRRQLTIHQDAVRQLVVRQKAALASSTV